MTAGFDALPRRERLHARVTEALARRVIQAEQNAEPLVFPKEEILCQQLGVSRTVLRESMKVLADKGMVEMKPRAGTRARPRSEWRLLDPDILAWQAEIYADAAFLRDLCEVRLAIEPTAAGFAAVRATPEEIAEIENSLREREARSGSANGEELIELDLKFHTAVVAASHNPLLKELSGIIREPFRIALSITSRFPSTVQLGLEAHHALLAALRRRDPMAARRAAEEVVGLAMLAVEKAIRTRSRKKSTVEQFK
ncbi:MAG TPA: FadR/GntR family transcriptional regulator [Bryobacteraceae bacterium]|nr:FadR/GntR family transcriptional regulator [Bryobacteraceae bacterium]HOL71316.1 FadR/GntR family transcriptional regulator [Bryobacteraceae bacterium]HOQ45372.1 FadR/GntR family transcriptional regulator [Bryobacteraceae bacterium]HPU71317.1 FadR/GntR family transcriptional regulator [Bryobacteraceae bacterium]